MREIVDTDRSSAPYKPADAPEEEINPDVSTSISAGCIDVPPIFFPVDVDTYVLIPVFANRVLSSF